MYAIKNVNTGKFAKHTGEIDESYPWELVDSINAAQKYTTYEHANEIAFWHLDYKDKWVIVDEETGKVFEKKMGKYLPV